MTFDVHCNWVGGSIPGWAVSTLLQWLQMSILLACNAQVGHSMFLANTVAVKNA